METTLPRIERDGLDRHFGARIRELRERANFSQLELGRRLGVTFQQIQKYENGTNRVSAGKLFRLAEILGAEVAYFYDGVPNNAEAPPVIGEAEERRRELLKFAASAEGLALITAYLDIADRKIRNRMLTLMRSVSEHGGEPTGG